MYRERSRRTWTPQAPCERCKHFHIVTFCDGVPGFIWECMADAESTTYCEAKADHDGKQAIV